MAGVFIVCGWFFIRRRNIVGHVVSMVLAILMSAVFLACYLYYHYHAGSNKFPDLGWIRTVYLGILLTHTILAALVPIFVLRLVYLAYRRDFEKHKSLGRIAFPIWLYVSVTGVIIYLMLYHLAPSLVVST
jgi:uncharacterized membrane protein YozB (DUF420 family)